MRYLFIVLFFFHFSILATPNPLLEKVTLLLDWKPNTNHIGFYVGMKRGYFAENGINLKILSPTQTTTTALVGIGKADFGISYANDIIHARNAQIPVVGIAGISYENTSCFVWRKSSNIKGVADFVGRRYGSFGSPEEAATLKYVMEQNGISYSNVKIIPMGLQDFLPATFKNVDFTWEYLGWNILAAKLQNVPVDTYCPAKHFAVFDKPSPFIITSENNTKNNPELVRRFIRATQKGYEFASENPNLAAQDLLFYMPELDKLLVEKSAEFLAPYFKNKDHSWGYIDKTKISRYARWMMNSQLIAKEPSVDLFIDNSFLTRR